MRKSFLGSICLLMAACVSIEAAPIVIPTETNTNTPIPTDTPIWFPPTEIPTLVPTIEVVPTQDFHPRIGNEIFSDNFSSPLLWNETDGEGADVFVLDNGINFVLSYQEENTKIIIEVRLFLSYQNIKELIVVVHS